MRAIRYNGNILTFAGKILRMAEWVYQEGVHYLRVLAGGGVTKDRNLTEDIYKMEEEYSFPPTVVGVLPESGRVERASGIYRFASKLFSLAGATNDVIQSTANSQPYLFKKGIKNPNGGSRFMTHPTVSFAANQAWSVSTMVRNTQLDMFPLTSLWNFGGVNFFGYNIEYFKYFFSSPAEELNIGTFTPSLFGKITLITYTYDGVNTLKRYINGVLQYTNTSFTSTFSANKLFHLGQAEFFYHFIRSGALTPTKITAEYNLLSSYFTEISTVQVGSKHIATDNCEMVATPKGNVISLNNLAVAGAELNTTPDLNTFSKGAGVTINSANSFTTTVNGGGIWKGLVITDTVYVVVVTGTSTSDFIMSGTDLVAYKTIPASTFNETVYFKRGNSANLGVFLSTPGTMTNFTLSVKEAGFSASLGLYNDTYAATSGTVAQKTLAALKAAAMWRSPDSDLDKQAVFGKIFNKFAAKLLKVDIDTYNTENPTAPWGYHVMTRSEAQALDALDANTLKATGTDLWTTANGTNTTGLDICGAGVINADGTYSDFKGKARLMTDDDYALDINDDSTSAEIAVTTEGGSLRLVKD